MNKFIYTLFILCCANISTIWATSYIYFQNNTSLPYSVRVSQYGGSLSASNWAANASSLTAWQKSTEVLQTSRNSGITNGVDFFYDIIIKNGTDSITLKVKLNGNFVGSDMWQSCAVQGFTDAWYNDRNFHEHTFSMQGKTFTLKYYAYFTGGDDDILYVLHEHDPFPVNSADLTDPNKINILSYNIYMLTPPVAYTDQNERAAALPAQIHGYDAIIFSEAFYNDARDNDLLPALTIEYPYFTPVVNAGTFNDDGGVFIASRWPIDTFAQIVYDDCDGSDCLAAKGVMYAKIDKMGKPYHIFGTHTQAWPDPIDVATRILQFQQLNRFIDTLNIPANEAVLVGGDLNVDKITNNMGEYDGMLDSLNALEPTYLGRAYTYDINYSYYTSGTVNEYLDYVLPIRDYFTPHIATNEPIILRSIDDDMFDMFDLSDHFAVQTHFEYPYIVQQPQSQAICEGSSFNLTTSFSIAATYQWYKNGIPLAGETNDTLQIDTTNLSNAGVYYCIITYNNGSIQTDLITVTVNANTNPPTLVQSNDSLLATGASSYIWLNPSLQQVGTSQNFFVPSTSGIYYAIGIDANGCLSDTTAVFYFAVPIEKTTKESYRIYPNPTQDVLNIEFSNAQILDIELFNAQGQKVFAQHLGTGQTIYRLSLEHLPQGVYYLQLFNNQYKYSEKIVKW